MEMDQRIFVTDGESKKILDKERIAIYVANRGRDTHMDYNELWGTPNFNGQFLTSNPELKTPIIATPFWYLTFCLFFLGWVYTLWFNGKCDTQEYTFIKQLSYKPFSDEQLDNNLDPTMYMNSGYGFSSNGNSAFTRTFNTTEQQYDLPSNMFTPTSSPAFGNGYQQQAYTPQQQIQTGYQQQAGMTYNHQQPRNIGFHHENPEPIYYTNNGVYNPPQF